MWAKSFQNYLRTKKDTSRAHFSNNIHWHFVWRYWYYDYIQRKLLLVTTVYMYTDNLPTFLSCVQSTNFLSWKESGFTCNNIAHNILLSSMEKWIRGRFRSIQQEDSYFTGRYYINLFPKHMVDTSIKRESISLYIYYFISLWNVKLKKHNGMKFILI